MTKTLLLPYRQDNRLSRRKHPLLYRLRLWLVGFPDMGGPSCCRGRYRSLTSKATASVWLNTFWLMSPYWNISVYFESNIACLRKYIYRHNLPLSNPLTKPLSLVETYTVFLVATIYSSAERTIVSTSDGPFRELIIVELFPY